MPKIKLEKNISGTWLSNKIDLTYHFVVFSICLVFTEFEKEKKTTLSMQFNSMDELPNDK